MCNRKRLLNVTLKILAYHQKVRTQIEVLGCIHYKPNPNCVIAINSISYQGTVMV